MAHGQGKLYNAVHNYSYEGEWMNNMKHGEGIYTYNEGSRYKGQYANDNKHGLGAYLFEDGKIYFGDWKEGQMSGQGTMIYPNLDMKKFLYEQGKPSSDPLELSPAEIAACHKVVEEMKAAKVFGGAGSRGSVSGSQSRGGARTNSMRRSSR